MQHIVLLSFVGTLRHTEQHSKSWSTGKFKKSDDKIFIFWAKTRFKIFILYYSMCRTKYWNIDKLEYLRKMTLIPFKLKVCQT